MPIELVFLVLGSVVLVALMRGLPNMHGSNAAAAVSLLILASLSWISALWLLVGIALTLGLIAIGEASGRKTPVFVVAVMCHGVALLILREQPGLVLLGGAYFTLRHIHVIADWWTGALPAPSTLQYLRYHLFLPVLAAGPIHRFAPFQRQLQRRRNDPQDLAIGAERLLVGAFQFTFFGGWAATKTNAFLEPWSDTITGILVLSAVDWIKLYFLFGGLSSMAIGLALMMGIKIEENFRQPWRAKDLPDFWSRWHVTLTDFSKDYVFRPISAVLGSGMLGGLAAMFFIGIWHGSSLYWGLWGFWHGAGILLTVATRRTGVFEGWPTWLGRVFAMGWLVAAHPAVSWFVGGGA